MHNSDNTSKINASISQEFHDFLADIETLLKESAVLTGEELSVAKAKIQEKVASAKAAVMKVSDSVASSASKVSDSLASSACKVAETTNQKVHAEPWMAVGAGAVVGLVLGLLFARR
jgi:ElaB/YqjD/DUF883 family membrane-anchored ribosome-binding protein